MSTPNIFNVLSSEELWIEFYIRNIDPKHNDAESLLSACLAKECCDVSLKPQKTHEFSAPQFEVGACRENASILSEICKTLNNQSDIIKIKASFIKAHHWYERALRFKNNFGDVLGITVTVIKLKRSVNFIKELLDQISSASYDPLPPGVDQLNNESDGKDQEIEKIDSSDTNPSNLPNSDTSLLSSSPKASSQTNALIQNDFKNVGTIPKTRPVSAPIPAIESKTFKFNQKSAYQHIFAQNAAVANNQVRFENFRPNNNQASHAPQKFLPFQHSVPYRFSSNFTQPNPANTPYPPMYANFSEFQNFGQNNFPSNFQNNLPVIPPQYDSQFRNIQTPSIQMNQHFQNPVVEPNLNFLNLNIENMPNVPIQIPPNYLLGSVPQVPANQVAAACEPRPQPQNQYADLNRPEHLYFSKHPPKWNISFDGLDASQATKRSLDVNDFVFRLQTFAEQDNFPINRLPNIVHNYVTDTAEKWWWVFKRSHPNATWREVRDALITRFCNQESERATRRTLESRCQKSRESFSDFALELESINGRLSQRYRFSEIELLEIMRENMNPALRNVTLNSRVLTIEELRSLCQRYEILWSQSGHDPRSINDGPNRKNISELEVSFLPPPACSYSQNVSNNSETSLLLNQPQFSNFDPSLSAVAKNICCWNCKASTHTFYDCPNDQLHVFCFGCGQENVRRPNCSRCIKSYSENRKPNTSRSGEARSIPIITAQCTQKTQTVATNTEPSAYR